MTEEEEKFQQEKEIHHQEEPAQEEETQEWQEEVQEEVQEAPEEVPVEDEEPKDDGPLPTLNFQMKRVWVIKGAPLILTPQESHPKSSHRPIIEEIKDVLPESLNQNSDTSSEE